MLTKEQKQQIDAENKAIADNIGNIKRRIIVLSGKGGVGKTTVSVNLAYLFHDSGNQTGLLDADITGPNVPKMLGIDEELHADGQRIIPLIRDGVKVVSIANMIDADQPIIWRGPMRSKLLHQFLGSVAWGKLDYLIADLPPGTGDEIITMTQKMQPHMAIIVTTPQELSLVDSRRAIRMAMEMGIGKIAVIENMSELLCPYCGNRIDMFGAGGGKRQAEQMRVSYLGDLPIDIHARKAADAGRPAVFARRGSGIELALAAVAEKIENIFHAPG